MNIFVTDPDPWKCARVLPDKHIVKMPLETCQMLSIVASEKWGRGFGTLLDSMERHTAQRRVRFVTTLALSGLVSLFSTGTG